MENFSEFKRVSADVEKLRFVIDFLCFAFRRVMIIPICNSQSVAGISTKLLLIQLTLQKLVGD